MFNDRLLLGLKGAMSEAELHILRARLNGGIRNKAARGELRRGLPGGFVWGEADGEAQEGFERFPIGVLSGKFGALFAVRFKPIRLVAEDRTDGIWLAGQLFCPTHVITKRNEH
jgi:hypothetical protein